VWLLREAPSPSELLDLEGHCEWLPRERGWLIDRWIKKCREYIDLFVQCPVCLLDLSESEFKRRTDHRGRTVCRCGHLLDADAHDSGRRGSLMPSVEIGVSLVPLRDRSYIAKLGLGLELSDFGHKTGRTAQHRTPFQIAHDWATDRRRFDAKLWRTYCKGMLGARQLTWSAGLRLRFGLVERSDVDLAVGEEPTADDRIVLTVSREDWATVRARRDGPVNLLEAVEVEGAAAAVQLLRSWR
jgi:hypothetical protein